MEEYKCDDCSKCVHAKYMVFRDKRYLCYECSRKHPPVKDPQDSVPVRNLVQLMMRREMGDCVRKVTADVNRVSSRADGMQVRHNLLKRWEVPNDPLLSKNEIIAYSVPEEEDPTYFAHYIVDHLGLNKDVVLSTIRIWLPEDQLSRVLSHHHEYVDDPLEYSGTNHLLIRLCPDWRNQRKPECDIKPYIPKLLHRGGYIRMKFPKFGNKVVQLSCDRSSLVVEEYEASDDELEDIGMTIIPTEEDSDQGNYYYYSSDEDYGLDWVDSDEDD